MKKTLLLTTFVLINLTIFSQELYINAGAGLSFIKENLITSKNIVNYKLGFGYNQKVYKFLSIRTGAGFLRNGYKTFDFDDNNFYYIENPVEINILISKKISLYSGISNKFFLFNSYNSEISVKTEYANSYILSYQFGTEYKISGNFSISGQIYKDRDPFYISPYGLKTVRYNYGFTFGFKYNILNFSKKHE